MVTLPIVTNPASAVRDGFRELPEIEQVYLADAGDRGVTALIVIDKKDYALMKNIFEVESRIIEALPGISINFDVIIREGRPVGDLVSPRGKPLIQR